MATVVNLNGQLAGQTGAGQLCGSFFNFTLTDQDDHLQTTASVGPLDTDKLVRFPVDQGPTGSQQTLFVAVSSAPVKVKLNGSSALTFNLEPAGPLIIGGQPEIIQAELSGLGSLPASVTFTKVIGPASVPALAVGAGDVAPAPGYAAERLADATAGQTAFTLSATPSDPTKVIFHVDGVAFFTFGPSPSITVSGTTVTWNDVEFVMVGGEKIVAVY